MIGCQVVLVLLIIISCTSICVGIMYKIQCVWGCVTFTGFYFNQKCQNKIFSFIEPLKSILLLVYVVCILLNKKATNNVNFLLIHVSPFMASL